MLDQTLFHYQLESSRTSATIYVVGDGCARHHIEGIAGIVDSLPHATRVLRVDMHGVTSIDLQTLMDLRAMLARWRTERNASVRLVLRAPLPREEWPTRAIQFERAPLRLVTMSRQAELLEIVRHRDHTAPTSRLRTPRAEAPLCVCGTSRSAR